MAIAAVKQVEGRPEGRRGSPGNGHQRGEESHTSYPRSESATSLACALPILRAEERVDNPAKPGKLPSRRDEPIGARIHCRSAPNFWMRERRQNQRQRNRARPRALQKILRIGFIRTNSTRTYYGLEVPRESQHGWVCQGPTDRDVNLHIGWFPKVVIGAGQQNIDLVQSWRTCRACILHLDRLA
jgi:hypothetical protein